LDNKDDEIVLRYPLIFDHRHYVPRLLWRVGEYQALLYLHDHTKIDVTPLIDIPEVGFDFDTGEDAKTIDQHLAKFAKRLAAKWDKRWAFVDLKLIDPAERMSDARHPLKFVFDNIRRRWQYLLLGWDGTLHIKRPSPRRQRWTRVGPASA
jgi:hypothetical protein